MKAKKEKQSNDNSLEKRVLILEEKLDNILLILNVAEKESVLSIIETKIRDKIANSQGVNDLVNTYLEKIKHEMELDI